LTERENRIREIAHRLWEEAGQPDGRDNEFWTRAEMQIEEQEKKQQPGQPLPATPPRGG
jgi:hypothetical protein